MLKINEMTSSELFAQMSSSQKDDIYRMVWALHVSEDVESVLEDSDIPEDKKEDIIESVSDDYVYCGDYDCNLSYWSNINNLIERYK